MKNVRRESRRMRGQNICGCDEALAYSNADDVRPLPLSYHGLVGLVFRRSHKNDPTRKHNIACDLGQPGLEVSMNKVHVFILDGRLDLTPFLYRTQNMFMYFPFERGGGVARHILDPLARGSGQDHSIADDTVDTNK